MLTFNSSVEMTDHTWVAWPGSTGLTEARKTRTPVRTHKGYVTRTDSGAGTNFKVGAHVRRKAS